ITEEVAYALSRAGLKFETRPDGRVIERDVLIGRVLEWEEGERITLRWHQADWDTEEMTEIDIHFTPIDGGTAVLVEHRGWGGLVGGAGELAGWFASEIAAPLLRASAPVQFGDWLTDRQARRPAGPPARAIYEDPLYHYPNFRVILQELDLQPDDYLLEVGCGGGALLQAALRSGCRAAGVDHSPEMVRLARKVNRHAIENGRLDLFEGSADALPFPPATFTCATMTGVLGFLPDPVGALAEIRRVLAPGGRIVVLGSDPELKGTPAAPEPMAARLRFYDGRQLEALGRRAGFVEVRVIRRDLGPYAREVGIPAEALPLFNAREGEGARFLVARKRDEF
ncbi:MAG TPA: methyltransferase domain-containing protein, partial [Longimicrobiaceae bacterium]|nr:methyltransferase domain-containing protein [Longimicrobiaceae bacterium]